MDTRNAPGNTLVGSTIAGRYELCKSRARGGMGTVYGGRDHRLCRPVAVKVIPLARASDRYLPCAGEQWWWEAWVMAAVRHPHIVQVFDAIRDRGHGYIVMELVDGDDLTQRLAHTGPLSYAEALSIGIQVCRALCALHTQGFIHCDIKPHNLLRRPDGCVKLADFGIAQAIGSSRKGLKASGAGPLADAWGKSAEILFGTATYCSPEQALCDPLTDATDVYSLGVVLYEVLAGVPPFIGQTPLAVLKQHVDAPVPVLHHVRPDIPPQVEQAILRALAKYPAQRFASAGAMCAALESARAALRSAAAGMPPVLPSGDPWRPSPSPSSSPACELCGDAERIAAVERQTTAIIYGPAGPRAAQGSRLETAFTETARGERGWDGEARRYMTDALPAAAIARRHVQRTRGIAVVLLCVADVVGLLLLITLLSWVH
jgi:eukaryotic-like serine/threonine-protein kinase